MSSAWIVAYAVLAGLVVLLALAVLGLTRRVTSLLERAETRLATSTGILFGGAPPGAAIPPFEVWDREGKPVASTDLLQSPQVVLLMEATCAPCRQLASELEGVEGRVGGRHPVVILNDTDEDRAFPLPSSLPVLFQRDQEASQAFQSLATPQAFAVRDGIVVDVAVPDSLERLRQLADRLKEAGDAAIQQSILDSRSHDAKGVVS